MPSVGSVDNSADRNYMDWINSNKTDKTDETAETQKKGKVYNAVFEDNAQTEVGFKDLFTLMVNQLTNQDFLNPTDDSQYLAQMVQITSMSATQTLAKYSQAQYMTNFIGKEVTITKYEIGGGIVTETGIVSSISWDNNNENYKCIVNDKEYDVTDIKNIALPSEETAEETAADSDKKEEKTVSDKILDSLESLRESQMLDNYELLNQQIAMLNSLESMMDILSDNFANEPDPAVII